MSALPDHMFLVLITLLALLVRMAPRWSHPQALTSDTYFHLYCARAIRESGFRLPYQLPRVVLGHEYTYPFLYHYLLALLPLKARLWLERQTGALFDSASLVAVYLFCLWLPSPAMTDGSPSVSLLVAALFALSPALLRIGSGPRAYHGSPRTVGQLFYLLHILAAYYAYSSHSAAALAMSVLAGAAVVVTAKFSTQVLLFFAPFFAALVSVWYLAVVGSAIAVAVGLTGGRAWRVLVGQYQHSVFYLRHLQYVFIHPGARSLKGYVGGVAFHLRGALARGEVKPALAWYFSESHPLHLLLTVFTPFLLLPFVAVDFASLPEVARFMLAWALAALAWFALTKARVMMFLGEGERYLEYATFPALYLSVSFLVERHPQWVYGFLAYSVLAAAWYLVSFHQQYSASEAAAADAGRGFETLNRAPRGMVMPIGSLHWQALYRSNFPVLTIGGNIDPRLLQLEEFMLVYGRYPYPSAAFAGILEKYGVRYIVSDRLQLRHYAEKILGTPEIFHDRVKALFDSPALVVYQVVPRK